jgi:hypothetical protein
LVVLASPAGAPERCRPILAPLVASIAVPAVIFLYTGGHALYYGSNNASAAPFMIGVALLAFMAFICVCFNALPRLAQRRPLVVDNPGNKQRDAPLVPSVGAEPSGVGRWHRDGPRSRIGRAAV